MGHGGGCRFQMMSYDLRIVVKMAQKLASGLFGSYWKHKYASEWTQSPFRPFMGHGGRLPFSTVAGPETSFKAILEVIGSLTVQVSGLVAYLEKSWDMVGGCRFKTTSYDLRIVVKMAQKPASGLFGSYWKHKYASEWTQRPLMGHGGRLLFNNIV